KMIATVEDLEAVAHDDHADVSALKGWRRAIFGEKALELKRGRLALAVENGRVVTFDWQEAGEPANAE
ncbi:MAG TPA: ribonuclease D, partial [Methylocystis sp.]